MKGRGFGFAGMFVAAVMAVGAWGGVSPAIGADSPGAGPAAGTAVEDLAIPQPAARNMRYSLAEKRAALESRKKMIAEIEARKAAGQDATAQQDTVAADPLTVDPTTGLFIDPDTGLLIPDYFGATANWAYTPPLRKFVDTLPPLGCTTKNNLFQCLPIAVPDQTTFPGSDYYEIELGEYSEYMHSDMPKTRLRGYRQLNVDASDPAREFHFLGPVIVANKDRAVRIKFVNSLTPDSKLFIPVDKTIMGAGKGPKDSAGNDCDSSDRNSVCADFSENRGVLHLHGGRTPWISDGTPHQWITPVGETTPYTKGESVEYVPDMWFDSSGNLADVSTGCQGLEAGSSAAIALGCATTLNLDINPGPGAQTYYWTNQQASRLMFYHDHSWGITRLNVYVGEAAGYLIRDEVENELIAAGVIPGSVPGEEIPLVIMDKTFVDAETIGDTDPTWAWGTEPGLPTAEPKTGDLWWPHIYVPAQNPYDAGGANPTGRWHYGPWFWPPTLGIPYPPVPNPYYDPLDAPWEPPMMPGTPLPSWGAEAFMDTPVINGTAYPRLEVEPKTYRFRILNAAHDRFFNLQLYVADGSVAPPPGCEANSEVKMVPAVTTPGFPDNWPTDQRPGGVPDPSTVGPSWIQIGNEGGFLPEPVVLPNVPVSWNNDVTTFNAGNVSGGTLILGPAERADVIIDFSAYEGKTLILYNDAPAPYPATDPHYDYYTGVEDLTDIGGSPGTPVGRGPNTRTIMQIKVAPGTGTSFDMNKLETAFVTTDAADGVFKRAQAPIIVGQAAYDVAYNKTFPPAAPYWGVANITDNFLSFETVDGNKTTRHYMEPKAIQDEMGEVFDDYGRMSAKLGLELPKTFAGVQTFMVQNFVDPTTEVVLAEEPQIWRITHNGVDTHPVHFHLFEVQLINRVGWDGFIRLPDPNEIGWKDTIRISPLEDTIVALRAKIPVVPFTVPDSVRVLNPSLPEYDPGSSATNPFNPPVDPLLGFTQIDPLTGLPRTVTNVQTNFGAEYVWHCHILSHEENDMMRTIILREPTAVPNAPTDVAAVAEAQQNKISWTDTQARPIPLALAGADYNRATGFKVQRCDGDCTVGTFVLNREVIIDSLSTTSTTPGVDDTYEFQHYADRLVTPGTKYTYQVIAFNAKGDSLPSSPVLIDATLSWPQANGVTLVPQFASPHPAPVRFVARATFSSPSVPPVIAQYQFSLDGTVVQGYSETQTWTMPADTALGLHTVLVEARTILTSSAPDAIASDLYTVISSDGTPTDILLSSTVVDEGLLGAPVGTLSTVDPDAVDTFTYTMANVGTGSLDNGSFEIDGDLLKTRVALDFNLKNLYSIRIRSTDAIGHFVEKVFKITPPSYVLWTKMSTGQAVNWKVDPDHQPPVGWNWLSPEAGVGSGWKASSYTQVNAAAGYVLWSKSVLGQAILWKINPATGAWTSWTWVGPPAGVGAGWEASSYSHVDATAAYVLWTKSSLGQAILWRIDPATGAWSDWTWVGPPAGVGAGWEASSYARVDATTGYILWTKSATGQAILWKINPDTGSWSSWTWVGPPAGVGAEWTASSYQHVDATTGHVLWTRSGPGQAVRWTINPDLGSYRSWAWISTPSGVGAGWQASSYFH